MESGGHKKEKKKKKLIKTTHGPTLGDTTDVRPGVVSSV